MGGAKRDEREVQPWRGGGVSVLCCMTHTRTHTYTQAEPFGRREEEKGDSEWHRYKYKQSVQQSLIDNMSARSLRVRERPREGGGECVCEGERETGG